ncbi:MAG: hypothetical protein AB7O04_16315 [Hyphomonadaceae bacterium]
MSLALADRYTDDFTSIDAEAASRHEDRDYIETDFCSRDGAAALKAKIEAYWRDRGENVLISLHNVGFHPAIRAARYDVRSDMVNGLPRSAIKKPKVA